MTFDNLGPMIDEARTPAVCQICGSYIFKRIYQDEREKTNVKTVFVCKTCMKNNE